MIGKALSHYRILDRLGEGGMGEVFLAEDQRLHRPVALKLLRGEACCEGDLRDQLLREARAASALNHPNIAAVYEVGEAESEGEPLAFLAMEYVKGETLTGFLAATPFDDPARLDRVLELLGQMVAALQAAHARGVVHRDLKPSNLMVTDEGLVKILDFGVAQSRRVGGADDSTWTWTAGPDGGAGMPKDRVAGTPSYMAPEQALGRPTDARADVFALGVVLFEAIAGRRPFEGETMAAVLDAVVHRPPPAFGAVLPPALATDPRVPGLERLLQRMLAKDPAQRPPSMREVAREVARLPSPPRAGGPAREETAAGLTVAVLGFRNVTGGGEDDWLASALTDTVTTAFAAIDGLEVYGRDRVADALRHMAEEDDPALDSSERRALRLGRRLGARWVVEGGFQRRGEQVRATAQILETESGKVVRAVQADGEMAAIFRLQDRLVSDLATGLRTSVAQAAEGGGETAVVGAFEALQRGVLNARVDTHESWERALLFFERAVALDPDYARAHLELGVAYAQKAESLVAPEFHERALAALRRARDLRPRWARPWREIGMSLVYLGRESEGLENIAHALKLAPDDATVLAGAGRAHFLGRGDFAQAAAFLARAVERNPQAGWYWLQLAHCRALLRDLDGGEIAAERAAEMQEEFLSGQQGVLIVGAHMRRAHLASLRGRPDVAVAHLQREVVFLQGIDHSLRSRILIELNMRLGAAHRALGNTANADAALRIALEAFERRAALGADDPYTRYYAAGAHALRGDADEAIASLRRAIAGRPAFTRARARIEPEFEGLRGERRFDALLGPEQPESARTRASA
jgi:TolB-like protein/tetratricopeptide (TPR) repeat protein